MKTVLRMLMGAFAVAVAQGAFAVHVSAEGSGQVLIYPYYTVQASEGNEFNTYVSIVNESVGQSQALRVRFREGRNGREVAGFNLLLRPRDAWTGAVVPTPTGARVLSTDTSCIAPQLATDLQPQVPPYLDFSDTGYTGGSADDYGTETTRTREGYIEVFQMASFDTAPTCADFLASNIAPAQRRVPSGEVSGTLTLINVQSGLDFTVNATALADAATQHFFRPPNDPYPDYTSLELGTVTSFFINGSFFRNQWASPLDAVNMALLAQYTENELVMDRNTRSGTDFVLTMPTKRLASAVSPSTSARDYPFSATFNSRDGEVRNLFPLQECPFMCPPGWAEADLRLRFASSVLSFRPAAAASAGPGTSDVLGSANGWLVNIPTTAENGYLSILFDRLSYSTPFPFVHSRIDVQSGVATPSSAASYAGLPVIAFMARTFRNGNLECEGAAICQGNYGGSYPNRTRRATYPP